MANLPKRAIDELVPAWHRFVAAALPAGQVSTAAKNATGYWDSVKGPGFSHTAGAAFLRRIANGGVAQPEPGTIWYVAEAARTLPGHEWCAGALCMFAAGHFEHFARIILAAAPALVPNQRKAYLVDAAADACDLADDHVDLERQLRDAGIAETIVRQQLRKLPETSSRLPGKRNAWVLTSAEEAAFQQAFVAPNDLDQSFAVLAARLAVQNPDIGLANQRELTTTALLRGLTS